MSQFKKYLGIVTEGRDYLYSEESESIEKYVAAVRKLIPSAENLNNAYDEKKLDTKEVVDALKTLNLGLQNQSISEEQREMVIKLLKNLEKLGKSQSKEFMDEVHMYIKDIEITLGIYKMK